LFDHAIILRNAPMPRRLIAIVPALLALVGLGWAALAPVAAVSRDELFEIPRGTAERRLAGEELEILPHTIRLGVHDVLVLRNADEAPHIFGPTLIMPGQTFRLPFTTAATYSFLCTAHADGQLNVIVEPGPAAGWERLQWRWRGLTGAG
jgi:hypothetical protein